MIKAIVLIFFYSLSLMAQEPIISREDEARLAFYMSRHKDIVSNNKKNFKRLLKRFKKKQVIGLELIIAAPSNSRVESRFGHTLLRFVDNYGNAGDDIVLSFVADLDDKRLSSARGVLGGYPVYPLLKTFRMFNRDYIKEENRSLVRHIIPSTYQMRKDLIEKLSASWEELLNEQKIIDEKQSDKAYKRAKKKAEKLLKGSAFEIVALRDEGLDKVFAWTVLEIIEDKKKIHHIEPIELEVAVSKVFGKYKFLSNNCAGSLVSFIKAVDFPNRGSLLWAGRIPIKVPTYFEKSLLNPLPNKIILGVNEIKEKVQNILGLNQEEFEDSKNWPINSALVLLSEFNLPDLIKLLDAFDSIPENVRVEVISKLPPLTLRPDYDQVYGIQSIDKVLYAVCEDLVCAEFYQSKKKKTWSSEELEEKEKRLSKLMKKLKEEKLKESLLKRPKLIEHYKLLLSL